jgi:ATP-dependent Lhr-like helicase
VQARRAGDPARGGDLGDLDAAAIDRVRAEALPEPRDADELHDALLTAGFLTPRDIAAIPPMLFDELVSKRRACAVRVGPDHSFAIAAERLPEWLAIDPAAILEPPIEAPASRRSRVWTPAEALVEILRGRLTITGPITALAIAESLGISVSDADAALLALEADGAILRGDFSPRIPHPGSRSPEGEAVIEWCDRSLLSRIHRYTLNRLRAEIEPVSPADFMRFLFSWHHVEPAAQLTSIDGLREIIAMLDGFELAASAWERAVLPARMRPYDSQLLDMLCLAGEVGWARLSVPTVDPVSPARLVPATPVALFLREHGDMWQRLRHDDEPQSDGAHGLSIHAQLVLDVLKTRGASFFNDLVSACALDADAMRQAIGALVAAGFVASDGFSGLRALVSAANGVPPSRDRRTNFAGRWTALEAGRLPERHDADVEGLARTLLRRYGVVFRRVLTREPAAAPWRELTRVYRRLEARGEIRGGRFVAGMSGEQFALPDAVDRLRDVRRTSADGRLLTISAADPLNLAGVVTAGDRIRTAARTRIVYRDGVPLAVREGDFTRELTVIDPAIAGDVARALSRRRVLALLR